jgi:hypothetical protein
MEVELQVVAGGTQRGRFTATGDPEDIDWLQYQLRNWLRTNHWPERQWRNFEIKSRRPREFGVIKTVKAV